MTTVEPAEQPLIRRVVSGTGIVGAARVPLGPLGGRDDEALAGEHLAAADGQPVSGVGTAYLQFLMMARAVLAERAEEPERTLAILAPTLDPAHPAGVVDRRIWLPVLTRLALAGGDAATAAAAARAADDDVAGNPTDSRVAAAQHCRGLLESDPTRLLAAAERLRAVGRLCELAPALEDAAVLLAERGDLSGAAAAHADAVAGYTALGAEWDLRRADRRLRPYGVRRRRTRRRPTFGWEALTPTELTVAHLVADGNSNPDIAARLFLSRRTVDVHVSHILAKLTVRSRVDIAREAIRHQPTG